MLSFFLFFFFFSVNERNYITLLRKWFEAKPSEATIIPACNSSRKTKYRRTGKATDHGSQELCESRFLLYFVLGLGFWRQCLTRPQWLIWESQSSSHSAFFLSARNRCVSPHQAQGWLRRYRRLCCWALLHFLWDKVCPWTCGLIYMLYFQPWVACITGLCHQIWL